MLDQPTEIEGTWEQIAAHAEDFAGHRLRVTILPPADALSGEPTTDSNDTRTLDEKLADIAASIPAEELARLPADLCGQIDHYAYGTPKR